jgi:predicted transposase YbfD/YdcC
LETRRCHVVRDIEWLEGKESWKGLCSLIKVHSTTEHLLEGRISEDTRYYISSLSKTAQELSNRVRAHGQIENKLHWVLDVSFSEDASLIHTPNAAENFSLLRKIALILLKKDPSRESIQGKRKRAGWDNDFLLSLLPLFDSK